MAYGIFTPQLLTKTNSITATGYPWTSRTSQWNVTFIAWNGTIFTAGSASHSRSSYSYDGMNWSTGSDIPMSNMSGIIAVDGMFVAIANAGTNRVMTSTNGLNWTTRSASQANAWRSITYGNGMFVAVTEAGTNRVMTSPDGINWTNRNASQASPWLGVSYGNGTFVAVANNGTNRVMTSPDGITWTNRNASRAGAWLLVKFLKDRFFAFDRTSKDIMYSFDGIAWINLTIAGASVPNNIEYMGGVFVIICSGNASVSYSSVDGINWQSNSCPTGNWIALAAGNGLFVAGDSTRTNTTNRMTAP